MIAIHLYKHQNDFLNALCTPADATKMDGFAGGGGGGAFEKPPTTENQPKLPKTRPRTPADDTFIVEIRLLSSSVESIKRMYSSEQNID